jgi:hypothetical protein
VPYVAAYPWLANIDIAAAATSQTGPSEVAYGCTGTLIAPNVVMCAAHCLVRNNVAHFLSFTCVPPARFYTLSARKHARCPSNCWCNCCKLVRVRHGRRPPMTLKPAGPRLPMPCASPSASGRHLQRHDLASPITHCPKRNFCLPKRPSSAYAASRMRS